MKRVQVGKKKEGRKKDLRLSGLYHHPLSSQPAKSFPRSAHFPRIRAIAIQGRGSPPVIGDSVFAEGGECEWRVELGR